MKKDLNISRPKSDEFEYIDYPTNYKPLGENEARIGYFHICEGNDECEQITVCEYESNHRPVRLPC